MTSFELAKRRLKAIAYCCLGLCLAPLFALMSVFRFGEALSILIDPFIALVPLFYEAWGNDLGIYRYAADGDSLLLEIPIALACVEWIPHVIQLISLFRWLHWIEPVFHFLIFSGATFGILRYAYLSTKLLGRELPSPSKDYLAEQKRRANPVERDLPLLMDTEKQKKFFAQFGKSGRNPKTPSDPENKIKIGDSSKI